MIIYMHLNLVNIEQESGMFGMKLSQFTHARGEHE